MDEINEAAFSIHAHQSKFPPFVYEECRKMLVFATGSQVLMQLRKY